jgi:ribosomal protein L11 methyltransferase
VDTDPQAVETAIANARANGVHVNAALADALPPAVYELVVSNILAQPLIVLAPLFAQRGLRVVLSGILEAQAGEVARAYEPWFDMEIIDIDDGWALLVGNRR